MTRAHLTGTYVPSQETLTSHGTEPGEATTLDALNDTKFYRIIPESLLWAVLTHPDLSRTDSHLWLFLYARGARQNHQVQIAHRTLAGFFKVSLETIRASLRRLRENGWLVTEPQFRDGRQVATRYRVRIPADLGSDLIRNAPDRHSPEPDDKSGNKMKPAPKQTQITQTSENQRLTPEPRLERKDPKPEAAKYTDPGQASPTEATKSPKAYFNDLRAILDNDQPEETGKFFGERRFKCLTYVSKICPVFKTHEEISNPRDAHRPKPPGASRSYPGLVGFSPTAVPTEIRDSLPTRGVSRAGGWEGVGASPNGISEEGVGCSPGLSHEANDSPKQAPPAFLASHNRLALLRGVQKARQRGAAIEDPNRVVAELEYALTQGSLAKMGYLKGTRVGLKLVREGRWRTPFGYEGGLKGTNPDQGPHGGLDRPVPEAGP